MDSFVTPRASSSSAPSPGAIDPLLCLRGIGKSYAAPVLQDVDLDLLPGEVHALMGANGAGKSTLACIISGLVQPDAGSMMLERSSYRPAGKAAAESLGVMKPVKPDQRLWYRRTVRACPAEARPALAASLRCRGLGCDRHLQRAEPGHASRRLRSFHVRHHRRRLPRAKRKSWSSRSGTRPMRGASRAASRCSSRAESCTPPTPGSGRPSGSSRFPKLGSKP